MAAAQSLCGKILDGGWLTGTAEGLGEDPGWRGDGRGRGEPPSGEAAVKGEPTAPPMGEGVGKTPGEGAGLALGCRWEGGDCSMLGCPPWGEFGVRGLLGGV